MNCQFSSIRLPAEILAPVSALRGVPKGCLVRRFGGWIARLVTASASGEHSGDRMETGAVRGLLRGRGAPLSALLVSILGVCLTVHYWCWLTGHGSESPGATVRNVALVIAAPVTLILALWRSRVAQRQADIAYRALHDESYRAAVGMLEHQRLFVRLGGIDTLLQLARAYPAEFHRRVVHILAAFVRHPPPQDKEEQRGRVREDVQTILVFYGERSAEALKIEDTEDFIIDLQGSDLSGIWLPRGANLKRVRLARCNLSDAVLDGVNGLTQSRIQGSTADPNKPPSIRDTIDCETGLPVTWPPNGPA